MIVWRVVRVADLVLPSGLDATALTQLERARRETLQLPADRRAFEAAHLLVRACAADLAGLDAGQLALGQHCATCGRAGHGAPSIHAPDGGLIDGVRVSLAHARGEWVAAAASMGPCGIDVEPVATSIPRGALTEREAAWLEQQPDPLPEFTRLWVRKEAIIKTGAARLADVASLDVLDDEGAALADRYDRLTLIEWMAPDGAAHACVAHGPGRTP